MDLGDYFAKVFAKMFNKDVYWPTFVLSIIYGIVFVILFIIGIFGFGASALLNMPSVPTTDPIAFQSTFFSMIGSMIGFFVYLGIIVLLLMYFIDVLYCFVISRVQATEKNKKLGFFDGFGKSFGKAFLLFVASLIYMLVMGLIFLVVWLIFIWIPILGWIIGFLLSVCLYIYLMVGMLVLTGKIANSESFGTALGQAFAKPFTHFKLVGYGLLFGLMVSVVSFILGLLALIPLLGQIIALFAGTAIMILFCALAYYFAQEK